MRSYYIAVIRSAHLKFSFINAPLIRYKKLTYQQAFLFARDLYLTGQFRQVIIFDRLSNEIKGVWEKREKEGEIVLQGKKKFNRESA